MQIFFEKFFSDKNAEKFLFIVLKLVCPERKSGGIRKMKKYSLSAATWIAALFLGIFTVYAGQLIGSAVQAQKQEQAENNDIKPPASSAQITAERDRKSVV